MRTHSVDGADTSMFDLFWHNYPRKVAKHTARLAFARLRPTPALLDQILEALAWQREQPQWRKDHGEFVPHASTYLNQRRWEDERPTDSRTRGEAPGRHACPHTPACIHTWACQRRSEIDAMRQAG